MNDYIKREDALQVFWDYCIAIENNFAAESGVNVHEWALEELKSIPSADVIEHKHGTFKDSGEDDEWYCHWSICNECGEKWMGSTNFCPKCGADMRNGDKHKINSIDIFRDMLFDKEKFEQFLNECKMLGLISDEDLMGF